MYFKLIDQAHCNIGHRYHVSADLAIPEQTIPYGIVLYRIISNHTISYRITSHHISYHIVSYHTILYHIWYIVSYTVLYGIIYYIIYIVSYIILYGITHRIIPHNSMSHDITYHVACSVVNHISYHTISHHIILSYHITYHIIRIYIFGRWNKQPQHNQAKQPYAPFKQPGLSLCPAPGCSFWDCPPGCILSLVCTWAKVRHFSQVVIKETHFYSANLQWELRLRQLHLHKIYIRYIKAQITWNGMWVHIPTSWHEHRASELSEKSVTLAPIVTDALQDLFCNVLQPFLPEQPAARHPRLFYIIPTIFARPKATAVAPFTNMV